MANMPDYVAKRLVKEISRFAKILLEAQKRDINEADTVAIVSDMLERIFGFDKYTEITREYAISGRYCDIAIKLVRGIEYLIEVKAIGTTLNDRHLKQAVDYASREGVKWVVLTNGIDWEIHRVTTAGKVTSEKKLTFDITAINPKLKEQQEKLFLLCKRGVQKDLLGNFHQRKQTVNRYVISALLLSPNVISNVCRQLKKFSSGLKIETGEVEAMIRSEIVKREVLDSDEGRSANRKISKFIKDQTKKPVKIKADPSPELQTQQEPVYSPDQS